MRMHVWNGRNGRIIKKVVTKEESGESSCKGHDVAEEKRDGAKIFFRRLAPRFNPHLFNINHIIPHAT